MAMGKVQRKVIGFLNGPEQRGRWLDTRGIANAIHEVEWASQEQMAGTRQALRGLERAGEVARMFYEWRSTKYPETEPSTIAKELGTQLRELLGIDR